jgi:hypothetical protein
MGLVGGVVTLPLLPLRGVVWLAEQLRQEALRQWTDPATIRAELQRVHERWSAGEIDAEERSAQEDALLGRLMARSRAGIVS